MRSVISIQAHIPLLLPSLLLLDAVWIRCCCCCCCCSGVFPFVFFFERTATLFQHRDPQAASYCKWAARALFRQINPYNDFPNIYYIVKAMGEVEAQLQAGGGRPISIPELVDIRSKTIMKNEYQKDKHRVDGGAGKNGFCHSKPNIMVLVPSLS